MDENEFSDLPVYLSDLLQETIPDPQSRAHIAAFLANQPVMPPTGEINTFSKGYRHGDLPAT